MKKWSVDEWFYVLVAVSLAFCLLVPAFVGCGAAAGALDKGCAVIHEVDAACQWLTVIRADGSRVRIPKQEGLAAMRRAGLEQPAP